MEIGLKYFVYDRTVGQKNKPMPKIVDKQEKRGRILDASVRVMARKGVSSATIADIADAAGVGKGTIYEYFRSKDEILVASFAHFLEKVEAHIAHRLFKLTDPLEKLLAYFEGWKDMLEGEFLDYMDIVLDFWAESIRKKQDIPGFNLTEVYREYRGVVRGLLDDCVAAGRLRPHDTAVSASVLIGAMDGLMVQYIADRSLFDMRQALDLMGRIVIDGLRSEGKEK